jgi:hypothetical protein
MAGQSSTTDVDAALTVRVTIEVDRIVNRNDAFLKIGAPASLPAIFTSMTAIPAQQACMSHAAPTVLDAYKEWYTYSEAQGYPPGVDGPWAMIANGEVLRVVQWEVGRYLNSTTIGIDINLKKASMICGVAGSPWMPFDIQITDTDHILRGFQFSLALVTKMTSGLVWNAQTFHAKLTDSTEIHVSVGDVGYIDSESARIAPSSCTMLNTAPPEEGVKLDMTLFVRFQQLISTGVNTGSQLTVTGLSFNRASPPAVSSDADVNWAVSDIRAVGCGFYRSMPYCEFAVDIQTACRKPNIDGTTFLIDANGDTLLSDTVKVDLAPITCRRPDLPFHNATVLLPPVDANDPTQVQTWWNDLVSDGTRNSWCVVPDSSLVIRVKHSTAVYSLVSTDILMPLEYISSKTPEHWSPVSANDLSTGWHQRSFITLMVHAINVPPGFATRVRIDESSIRVRLGNGLTVGNSDLLRAMQYPPKLGSGPSETFPAATVWCQQLCGCDLFALHRRTLDHILFEKSMQSGLIDPSTGPVTQSTTEGEDAHRNNIDTQSYDGDDVTLESMQEDVVAARGLLLRDAGPSVFFAEWDYAWNGDVSLRTRETGNMRSARKKLRYQSTFPSVETNPDALRDHSERGSRADPILAREFAGRNVDRSSVYADSMDRLMRSTKADNEGARRNSRPSQQATSRAAPTILTLAGSIGGNDPNVVIFDFTVIIEVYVAADSPCSTEPATGPYAPYSASVVRRYTTTASMHTSSFAETNEREYELENQKSTKLYNAGASSPTAASTTSYSVLEERSCPYRRPTAVDQGLLLCLILVYCIMVPAILWCLCYNCFVPYPYPADKPTKSN